MMVNPRKRTVDNRNSENTTQFAHAIRARADLSARPGCAATHQEWDKISAADDRCGIGRISASGNLLRKDERCPGDPRRLRGRRGRPIPGRALAMLPEEPAAPAARAYNADPNKAGGRAWKGEEMSSARLWMRRQTRPDAAFQLTTRRRRLARRSRRVSEARRRPRPGASTTLLVQDANRANKNASCAGRSPVARLTNSRRTSTRRWD